MNFSPLIQKVMTALQSLPGVGPKSAQRMVFHLLQRDKSGGKALALALLEAIEKVGHCENCRILSEHPLCRLCDNSTRDKTLLCVVETPADVLAIEYTSSFRGYYFVLMGHLSPLDGIGPEDLGMDLFRKRLREDSLREVILATNSTVEGEATAHYLAEIVKKHQSLKVTRIAHGVPMGGELEYIDGGTLTRALLARVPG